MLAAKCDQPRHVGGQRNSRRRCRHAPVQPRQFVVLAVGIVVAVLRATEFVAGQQHRCAGGKEHGGQHRALHPVAHCVDRRIVGRPLDAPVAGEVGGRPVAIAFAVRLVVPLDIAHGVREREAIMGGDEIDRCPWTPAVAGEDVGRTRKPCGNRRPMPAIAAPEATHAVTKSIVPFGEARRMVAELIASRTDIPGFGDQLHAGENRILAKRVEEAGTGIEPVRLAAQRRAEIEAKSIDVERVHPVAQRIHHHLQHTRMREVDRVAGARIVDVAARIVRLQPIVAGIVEPAKRQRRPGLLGFGGVVVDHVEDHLDAGGVQPAHRDAHLVRRAVRQIRRFRREEGERVVAPVVAQPALQHEAVLQEGMHRHQFDRGDAEPAQVIDHRGMRQGPAKVPRSDGRMSSCSMVSPRTCAS